MVVVLASVLARASLASIFLNSSGSKAFSLRTFSHWLRRRLRAPQRLAGPTAIAIVASELSGAILVALPWTWLAGASLIAAMLLLFAGVALAWRELLVVANASVQQAEVPAGPPWLAGMPA